MFTVPLQAQQQTPGCQANEPGNLTTTSVTQTTATFTWTANGAFGGEGYEYEVRTTGTPGVDTNPALGYVTSGSTTNTTVTVSGLAVNTSYCFHIRYVCSNTSTSTYETACFTTLPLAAPVAVPATFVEDDSFNAIWQASEGAASYLLDVSTDPNFGPGNFVPHISGYDENNDPIIDFYYENFATSNTSRIIDDLQPLTTYYYRVQAVLGATTTVESNVITVTTTDVAPTETFWTSGGWTSDPTLFLPATMLANFNSTTDGNIEALDLTINPGVVVQISSGNYAYVINEIVNNAGVNGFIIKSNANLFQENDVENVGDITVERESSDLFRLDYTMWSSPTAEGTSADQTLKQFSPATVNNRFYTLNTATNAFTSVDPLTTTFEEGRGYMIRMPNNHVVNENGNPAQSWTGSFKGIPNNGTVVVPISDAGVGNNLIGNPYPSAISADDFISLNDDASITGTLYFWRRTNNPDEAPYDDQNTYYATYNLSGGTASTSSEVPNSFIKPGQGFIVDAQAGATSVTFENEMRSYQHFSNQFFRSNAIATVNNELEKHRIWLNLTNEGGAFSQTLLGYIEDATDAVDYGFDGLFINDTGIALTSYLNNAEYTIQGRALPFNAADVVPLNLKTPIAASYSISISQVDGVFAGDQGIYLRDNLLDVVHDLKESPYTFATEAGSFSDRFEVLYQSSLGINDPSLDANDVIVFKQANDITINAGNNTISSVKVFDIRGRLLVEKHDINSNETSINAGTDKQVLIVQITSNENQVVTKKVIN